jgi:predicted HicB family RNase H-like nuclease
MSSTKIEENPMENKRTPRKITTVENAVKFSFRVPADMYALLEKEAIANKRSINSQLIQILTERYATQQPPPSP